MRFGNLILITKWVRSNQIAEKICLVEPMRAAELHVDVFQLHVERFCQHFAIGKSEAVFNPSAPFL